MKLKDFKIIRNTQRPDLMYQYKHYLSGYKIEITTMNSGKSFLVTIESLASNERTYLQDFSKNDIRTIDECLIEIDNYLEPL